MKKSRMLLAAAAVALLGSQAMAAEVTIEANQEASTSGIGNFTGTVGYNSTTHVLEVRLTNLCSTSVGGYISGFVFNIHGNASATLQTPDSTYFKSLTNPSASPFGTFEYGAALGADFLGGGSPTGGIGSGATGTFHFDVTGSGASSLGTMDFLTDISGSGTNTAFFVVRFKGFNNGQSDKSVADDVGPTAVPLPSAASMGLMTLALAAAGLIHSRRRKTLV